MISPETAAVLARLRDPLLPTQEEQAAARFREDSRINGRLGAQRTLAASCGADFEKRKQPPRHVEKAPRKPKEPRQPKLRAIPAPKPPRPLAPPRKPSYDVAAILRDCDDASLSTKAIAARHGVSARVVQIVARQGGKPRPRHELRHGATGSKLAAVQAQVLADRKVMTIKEVCAKYACSPKTIARAVGCVKKPKPLVISDDEFAARWATRVSTETLARSLHWHKSTVATRAARQGLDMTQCKTGRRRGTP